MSNRKVLSVFRGLAMTAAASTLLGLGAMAPAIQAAEDPSRTGLAAPLILAETEGMERREERRDDRQGDRQDRQDNRRDCRDEGGVVGKDKRDCKQEGRQEAAEGEPQQG